MTIVRARIAAAVCAAVSAVALAMPASAGGPTSVTLTAPGDSRPASLSYTESDYDLLGELVGINETIPEDAGGTHPSGSAITATWLIHDVDPWRIDRIYLDAEGGPWIATQVMDHETGEISGSPVVWHQPQRGMELAFLLERLLPAASVPEPAPIETPEPAAAPAEPADRVSGAWWGLGGLVAGALLALGWTRFRPARAAEPELDPDADWLVPQTRSTSA